MPRMRAGQFNTDLECVLLLECVLFQVLGGAYASAAARGEDAHGALRETKTETDRQRVRLERERERERETETEEQIQKKAILRKNTFYVREHILQTKAILRVSESLELPRLMKWILNARDLRAKTNFSHANVANKW